MRLLLFMVPLTLLFVTIVFYGPKTCYWSVTNYPYYVWLWRSSSTANNVSSTNTDANFTTFLETNADEYFPFNGSHDTGSFASSPPVDVKQVKEEKQGISMNKSTSYKPQKRYSNLERVEFGLGHARAAIRMGISNISVENKRNTYDGYVPHGPVELWSQMRFGHVF